MWQYSHFIKVCPLGKQDTKVLQGKYTNLKTDTNTNSTPDKVMEPLTRLFTDLIEHLRLLTPLGHNPNNGHPNYKRNGQYSQKQAAYPISHRQHGTTTQHRHSNTYGDCNNDQRHQTDYRWKGHGWDSKNPVGHNKNMLQSLIPEYTKSSQEWNVILSVQLPMISRKTRMRRMFLHQTHQKTNLPLSRHQNGSENLRGSAFHEKVVRHPSSLVHTANTGAETEIVHIGRKSHNKCTVITMIGNRSQKAIWDSVAGKPIKSYDCYKSLHPKYRMGAKNNILSNYNKPNA